MFMKIYFQSKYRIRPDFEIMNILHKDTLIFFSDSDTKASRHPSEIYLYQNKQYGVKKWDHYRTPSNIKSRLSLV